MVCAVFVFDRELGIAADQNIVQALVTHPSILFVFSGDPRVFEEGLENLIHLPFIWKHQFPPVATLARSALTLYACRFSGLCMSSAGYILTIPPFTFNWRSPSPTRRSEPTRCASPSGRLPLW